MLNREVLRQELISRRTFLISTGKVGVLSVLLARMAYLQLIKGSEYKILSDKNRITLVLSPPARGMILDRTGLPIVDNKTSFVLKLDRKQTSDYTKSLEEIFEILLPSEDAIRDVFSAIKKSNKKIPVTIFSDISWEEVSKIEERLHKLDGFYVESSSTRVYNFALSCAHLTGYIGKVSDADGFDQLEAASDIRVGKTGIEKFYEKTLQGEFGYKKVEVDAKGIFVNEIENVESKPGENLKLNIDIVLQEALYNLMSEKGASATVVDLSSGGIIGFCSSPSFDPNLFINGVKQNYWKELRNSPFKPLINKLAYSQYPPGSTFKIVTILAALEAGISPDYEYFCSGSALLGTKTFNCWLRHGHGKLDMRGAIKHSCNCYMFNIGKIIGGDKIINTARKLGYGSPTGIDLPSESKGFLPDREWKLRRFKFDWSLGDTFNISIGQGALLSTPIQQMQMMAAIASRGKFYKPRLAEIAPMQMTDLALNDKYLDVIFDGMYKVVNEEGGTAYKSRSSRFAIAGKTGTSQVQGKKNVNDDLSRASVRWERRNHALFAGFAPFDNPKYAVSVIVDHGGGGSSAAAPIAKRIFEYLL